MDVEFLELLRTATSLDENIVQKLDGLIDFRCSPECIHEDAQNVIFRLAAILEVNPTYLGPRMARVIDQLGGLARTAFGFGEECDGYNHIIAVGVLVILRLSFVYILGFTELPGSDGRQCRGRKFLRRCRIDAGASRLLALYGAWRKSSFGHLICEDSAAFFSRGSEL